MFKPGSHTRENKIAAYNWYRLNQKAHPDKLPEIGYDYVRAYASKAKSVILGSGSKKADPPWRSDSRTTEYKSVREYYEGKPVALVRYTVDDNTGNYAIVLYVIPNMTDLMDSGLLRIVGDQINAATWDLLKEYQVSTSAMTFL